MARPVATEDKREELFTSKISITPLCWIWNGTKSDTGYGMFFNGKRPVKAHRFSYSKFKGEIPPDKFILHSCSNRLCVNPHHLRIGTQKENMDDAIRYGSAAIGHKNKNSKITKEKADSIKSLYIPRKFGCLKLARVFHVSKTTIVNLVSGKSYRGRYAYGS